MAQTSAIKKQRFPLGLAEMVAEELLAAFTPHFEQAVIAALEGIVSLRIFQGECQECGQEAKDGPIPHYTDCTLGKGEAAL